MRSQNRNTGTHIHKRKGSHTRNPNIQRNPIASYSTLPTRHWLEQIGTAPMPRASW
jgi:hypothetical protein